MLRKSAARLALLCWILVLPACDQAPPGPSSPLNAEFTLAPGESMRISDASLAIRFNGVTGDSRCPADAVCIQGGSAGVGLTVASDRATRDYEIQTGDMKPIAHDGFTVALVQLQPFPFSSKTIAPGDYRATLKVTR